MYSSRLQQFHIIKQGNSLDRITSKGQSLTKLLHDLIREHGTYHDSSYRVDVEALPICDKRLLLSHFESAEWYEYACQSHLHTETLFAEHKDFIQELIDRDCREVFIEDQEEMRSYK